MNILLCMPKVQCNNGEWPVPPVGVSYVSSSLKKAGYNIYTLNFIYDKRTVHEALKQMIIDYNISLIGCGGLVVNLDAVKDIIDTARRIKPDIITLIGGGLVTFSPVESMELINEADYGVIGEGEITTCNLIQAIENNIDISQVNNIIYRCANVINGNKYVITNDGGDVPNLDNLPFPDYEEFLAETIQSTGSAAVVSSRSCPYKCTFCSHSGGQKYRQRSLDSIFEEIDYLVHKYKIRSLFLNDELFSVKIDRLVKFCERIRKCNLQWNVYLRLSKSLTPDILRVMKDSGCVSIFFGLESADDNILKSMNKGTNVALMERVLRDVANAGIKSSGAFIFGDVEETLESVNNTISWVKNNREKLSSFSFVPIVLYPGSKLYTDAVRSNIIDPISHIQNGCPIVNISKLSNKQYREMVEFTLPKGYASIVKSKNQIDISFDKGSIRDSYQITLVCPKCSRQNKREISVNQISIDSYTCSCEICGNNYATAILGAYTKWVDDKLAKIIREYNCAFWPYGGDFMIIYEYSRALKDSSAEYSFIDINPGISKRALYGRRIFLPNILSESNKFDTVIICSYFREITNMMNADYPNIRQISIRDIGMMDI